MLQSMTKGYGKIEVDAKGSKLAEARGLISASVAFGFVQQDANDVNLINAMEILKGRGGEVSSLLSSAAS